MTDAVAVGRSRPVTEPGAQQTTWMRSDAVLRGSMWVLVAIVVVGLAVLFVELTDMQPEYDAYGWLVWGRQTLHWNLDTNGAPSWKPLTFLFTVPYALSGNTQPWLWMVTSVAAAFAGAVFAGRIAYRLGAPAPRYARLFGALLAGAGVLGIVGYWPLILIASADPLVVALCLAAIDAHLCGRPRIAFALLVLAGLGRPEAWLFIGLYSLWAWRSVPRMRLEIVAGLAVIPALWFGISALTAKTWLRAGDVALGNRNALRHHEITGVLDRFADLYEVPMQFAALVGICLGAARRERTVLTLTAAAVAWLVVEIAFAYRGFPATPRYMVEPAAIMVVLAGVGVARLLAMATRVPLVARPLPALAVAALVVTLVPAGRDRVSVVRQAIQQRRTTGVKIERLASVIALDGGPKPILACGTPVSIGGYQSTLAWHLGLNVGYVGHKPGRAIHKGYPIVLFKPYYLGWLVIPIHIAPAQQAACARLRANSAFGSGTNGPGGRRDQASATAAFSDERPSPRTSGPCETSTCSTGRSVRPVRSSRSRSRPPLGCVQDGGHMRSVPRPSRSIASPKISAPGTGNHSPISSTRSRSMTRSPNSSWPSATS